jgi:hypothetical protein
MRSRKYGVTTRRASANSLEKEVWMDVTSVMNVYIATWRPALAAYSIFQIKLEDVFFAASYHISLFKKLTSATHIHKPANRSNGNRFSHTSLQNRSDSAYRTRERWKGRKNLFELWSNTKGRYVPWHPRPQELYASPTRQSLKSLKKKPPGSRRETLVSSILIGGLRASENHRYNKVVSPSLWLKQMLV